MNHKSQDMWIDSVLSVKKAVVDIQPNYSSTESIDIVVNNKIVNMRTDASGFILTCLKVFGVIPEHTNLSTDNFVSRACLTLIKAYLKPYAFNGFEDLLPGDIIANKDVVEIYMGDVCNTHTVCGCTSDTTIKTSKHKHCTSNTYDTIWRPAYHILDTLEIGTNITTNNNEVSEIEEKKKISIGSKVKVLKAEDFFTKLPFDDSSDIYDVININGDKVIIAHNNIIVSAIDINNIEAV